VEKGLNCDALGMIMSASSNDMVFVSELEIEDEASGLLPFMYGASLENCKLDVLYELAMRRPDLLTRMYQESNDSTVRAKRKWHNSNNEHTSAYKK
jgi:hypothetical protein